MKPNPDLQPPCRAVPIWRLALRITLRLRQLRPRDFPIRIVEGQQRRSGAVPRGQGNEAATLNAEVFAPTLRARIEQRHDVARLRVHRGDVRYFEPIALEAGVSQVGQFGAPAMLRGDDVVRFVGEERRSLGQPTRLHAAFYGTQIFSDSLSPFPDFRSVLEWAESARGKTTRNAAKRLDRQPA